MTEDINPKSKGIDRFSALEILRLMNEEDASVIDAVREAMPMLERAVEDAVGIIKGGGRIFYAGAGTSGRLAVLDASEMHPTFNTPRGLFNTVMAGGDSALGSPVEGAEDDKEQGRSTASELSEKDMAIGITASGRTPFVISFLEEAKGRGARCWLMTCSEAENYTFVDGIIKIPTGPEIIAGSTRLKAGTATKLALNMFSTTVMIRLGRVYDGLMVDVVPSNKKLIKRAEGIIMTIASCTEAEAQKYLRLSGMNAKVASVMIIRKVSKKQAEGMLERMSLREIIEG